MWSGANSIFNVGGGSSRQEEVATAVYQWGDVMGCKIALVLAVSVGMGATVEIARAIPACSGDACNFYEVKLISSDQDSLRFSVRDTDNKRAIQFVGCVTTLKSGHEECAWQFEGVIEVGKPKEFSGPLPETPKVGAAMKFTTAMKFAIFRNDDDKAQIEQLEKEKEALQKGQKTEKGKTAGAAPVNCKEVKINNLTVPVCCVANKDAGCVKNAEDCKLLGGTEKATPESACDKGFPGYTGQVARTPAIDCSSVKVDAVWTAAKGFKKLRNGQCEIIYDCALKSAVPQQISIACEPAFPVSQARAGTCTDAKCNDCKPNPPETKCTVHYVKK
jgi:hypothetical protein